MVEEVEMLKKIMRSEIPVLFLGAGFSFESSNDFGTLPKADGLKNEIYDKFIYGKVDKEQEQEIQQYNLRETCQVVNELLEAETGLKQYLLQRFKGVRPQEWHYNLLSYPWKKIYTVNIDDLVEHIYRKGKVKLIVQNTAKEKKVETEVEYVKLHGCVNAPDEPIVFSEKEYTTLISKKNYKLDKLTSDILRKNIIFVGADFNEPDIDFYLTKYESAGFSQKGKLIFINPSPSVKLQSRVKALNGILIKWTAQQFLDFIKGLNYNPNGLERAKRMLNYYGMYRIDDIMKCFSTEDAYESRLYHGYNCKWEDVFYDWVIKTQALHDVKEKIVLHDVEDKNYCIAIVGNSFAGKTCILKECGPLLEDIGYDVIEYKGNALNLTVLKKYIENSTSDKVALLVDNASYYYRLIEKLLQTDFNSKKLFIITTSRTFYHAKKRYYLENNPYEEIFLEDKIDPRDLETIYRKIKDKGYLGEVSINEQEGIKQIIRKRTYINLFSYLTYGEGFKKKIHGMATEIFKSSNEVKELFIELVIFSKADLPYYPSELVSDHYNLDYQIFIKKNYDKLKPEQQLIVDNLAVDSNGVILKNTMLIDEIWKKISNRQKLNTVYSILVNISSFVSEHDENYWRIIFESLLKEEQLEKNFKLKKADILSLFYKVKDYYKEISYYWLQLGIAEQKVLKFDNALNHLQIAKQIRPQAYQIQHAIARNYLKHANVEKKDSISKDLFQEGEKLMIELINSSELYKEKARNFSIHCYIYEKIRYMEKHQELIEQKTCKKMKVYIDKLIAENDVYSESVVALFVELLSKHNLISILRMKPGDIYFKALNPQYSSCLLDEEEDILIDSY